LKSNVADIFSLFRRHKMISKNKIKFIQSLSRKKEREETGLFIAEGEKLISELVKANYPVETILTTNNITPSINPKYQEVFVITEEEMKKISLLKTPSSILAILRQPSPLKIPSELPSDLILVLDNIQDPGNFGTIIRIASWFGIRSIICSDNCVDCYNPKVIQATMGAIAHIQIYYSSLPDFFVQARNENRAIFGTYLEGENIYTSQLYQNGIIVMGNEGKGISNELEQFINRKIVIPSFSIGGMNIESLNVSVATAIVCSEFRRRSY
jgi:RNA methyltransferase, TrmH family